MAKCLNSQWLFLGCVGWDWRKLVGQAGVFGQVGELLLGDLIHNLGLVLVALVNQREALASVVLQS